MKVSGGNKRDNEGVVRGSGKRWKKKKEEEVKRKNVLRRVEKDYVK